MTTKSHYLATPPTRPSNSPDPALDAGNNPDRTSEIQSTFRQLGLETPSDRQRLLRLANPAGIAQTKDPAESQMEIRSNTLIDGRSESA